MKYWLTIILFSLFVLPVRADDHAVRALANEPFVANTLTDALNQVAARQISDMAEDNPTCFFGEFKQKVSDYLYGLAKDTEVHKRALAIVEDTLTPAETRVVVAYYATPEGKKALTEFTRSIRKQKDNVPKADHPFFATELGQKIVAGVPEMKRKIIWQVALLIKDNFWDAKRVFFEEFTLAFECKNANG